MNKNKIIKDQSLVIATLIQIINSLEDDNKSLKEVNYNLISQK